MARLTRTEIEASLAERTGQSVGDVASLLDALVDLAHAEVEDGFLLPGLGELRVTREPDRERTNPFTGEPVLIRGAKSLQFEPDSTTLERFIGDVNRFNREEKDDRPRVLPQIKLNLCSEDMAKAGLEVYDTNRRTDSHVGGHPHWIQGPEQPKCCANPMTFYAQIDSEEMGGEFSISDAGIIYTFVCDHCFRSRSITQYY